MVDTKVKKVFGAPGSGKTTFIINDIRSRFRKDNPLTFTYVVFTRAMRNDFRERVKKEFDIDDATMKEMWVGTLHSICYRLLGLERGQVVMEEHRIEFCRINNLEYKPPKIKHDDELEGNVEGDFLDENLPIGNNLFILDSNMRMRMRDLSNVDLRAFILSSGGAVGFNEVRQFLLLWKSYKEERHLYDYVDMLECVFERNLTPPTKELYADEFQDNGDLQYAVFAKWRDVADYVVIAGDDDQSIYSFLGARPELFLKEEGDTILLENNYRNTKEIFQEATRLIARNKLRQHKEIKIFHNNGQSRITNIDMYGQGEHVFVKHLQEMKGRTFILTRTNRQKQTIGDCLDRYRIPYIHIKGGTPWSDGFVNIYNALRKIKEDENNILLAEEIRALCAPLPSKQYLLYGVKGKLKLIDVDMSFVELKEKYFKKTGSKTLGDFDEKIVAQPETIIIAVRDHLGSERQRNIIETSEEDGFVVVRRPIETFIGTFHSSKGLECENAILVDSMPKSVSREIIGNEHKMEEERRVYYVAMTRARTGLSFIYNFFDGCGSFLKMERKVEF